MSLSLTGIYKSFDAVEVLNNVDFWLGDGEIRALIGENGAGKTTLMNILGGVFPPTRGSMQLDGKPVRFAKPRDSLDAGIAFIHQELNLVNDLAIYENMFLGRELHRPNGMLDAKTMCAQAADVLRRVGIELDPRELVANLDASYKQVVEISRALLMKARIIIMDEPTTSLTEVEIERVFQLMRTLKTQKVSIIFISHKLKEVIKVCDTYTVLRDGKVAASGDVAYVTELALARAMVGHDIPQGLRNDDSAEKGSEILRCEHLTLKRYYNDISFSLHTGEVLGFTGLLGDGRSELFRTVFGDMQPDSGAIYVRGQKTRVIDTEHAKNLSIGYVPRNRKENGIVPDMTIEENGTLVSLRSQRRGPFLNHSRLRAMFGAEVDDLHIKLGHIYDPITSLSGGNQQKVVLAKWLAESPELLIFDNPTQGVDVGAKEDIYEIISELACKGVGVVVLSSEATEIMRICNRVLVMYHGRLSGELRGDEMTEEAIMVLATGAKHAPSANARSSAR